MKQLKPQVLQVEDNIGSLPEGVAWSFDAGYFGGANIKFLLDKKIDGYIPDNKIGIVNPYDKGRFSYDMESDEYLCPEKRRLKFLGEHFDKQKNKTVSGVKEEVSGVKEEVKGIKTRLDKVEGELDKQSFIIIEKLSKENDPSLCLDFAVSNINAEAGKSLAEARGRGKKITLENVKPLTNEVIRPYVISEEELRNTPEQLVKDYVFMIETSPTERHAFRAWKINDRGVEVLMESNANGDGRKSAKTITVSWSMLVQKGRDQFVILRHTKSKGGRELNDREIKEVSEDKDIRGPGANNGGTGSGTGNGPKNHGNENPNRNIFAETTNVIEAENNSSVNANLANNNVKELDSTSLKDANSLSPPVEINNTFVSSPILRSFKTAITVVAALILLNVNISGSSLKSTTSTVPKRARAPNRSACFCIRVINS